MAAIATRKLWEDEVRLVQQIVKLLEPLPVAKRLLVLREVEKIVRSQINVQGVLRKVSRVGKAGFKIGIPVWMAPKEGRYDVIVEGNKLIYVEARGQGNASIRFYNSIAQVTIPKWALERIGMPEYVFVRIEGDKLIIEPA